MSHKLGDGGYLKIIPENYRHLLLIFKMPQNNSDFVGSEQTLTISSEFKLVNTSMLVQIHQKLFLKCYLKLLCKVLVLVLNFLQIIKK